MGPQYIPAEIAHEMSILAVNQKSPALRRRSVKWESNHVLGNDIIVSVRHGFCMAENRHFCKSAMRWPIATTVCASST